MTKRILALDIGSKRTGVAISDEGMSFSFPHSVLEIPKKEALVSKVVELVETEEVGELVVGLPLNQHGEEGEDAKNIRTYIALLRERLEIPVVEWDERFTTLQAERSLLEADVSRAKRKQVVDKIAATIILQSYLDSRRFQQTPSFEDES